MSLFEVGEKAAEVGADRVVIIDRWKGGVGKIRFFKLGEKGLAQVAPLIHMRGVKLCREFNVRKRHACTLVVDEGDRGTREVKRLKENLSSFFGATVMSVAGAPSKHRTVTHVSADNSSLLRISFHAMPENVEIGPCITVSHVAWEI